MHRIKNEIYTNSKDPRTKLQSKQHKIKLSSQIWFHQSFIFYNLPLFDEDKYLGCFGMFCLEFWLNLQSQTDAETRDNLFQINQAPRTSLHLVISKEEHQPNQCENN